MVRTSKITTQQLLNEAIDLYMSTLKSIDSFVSEPAAEFQLSFEQYLILHDVATRQDVMLMAIAARRHVTRSAISRQIKVLLKNKYIYQRADPKDRRRLFLRLTKQGKHVENEIRTRVEARFASWLDIFGTEQATNIIHFGKEFGEKVIDVGKNSG